ncbi:MAG: hypothetical protein ACYS0I_00990 [Planctomycetota bacterium]|jgi:hypothetical protein
MKTRRNLFLMAVLGLMISTALASENVIFFDDFESGSLSQCSRGAGLIALEEYPQPKGTGLQVGGNSILDVNNGAIQVNSWSEDHPWSSFRADGDFTIDCTELNVRGTVTPEIDDPYWDSVDYSVNEHTGPLPDPLEHLPELRPLPAMTAQWGVKTINSSLITSNGVWSAQDNAYVLTIGPGYYPGGINMTTSNCKLVLQPGIYALGGTRNVFDPCTGGFIDNGGDTGLCIKEGTLVAEGVMLYITESLEGKYGVVNIRGVTNVSVTITQYDSGGFSSYYDGMAIFQDRANTEEAYIVGFSETYLEGTLYFKNANCRVGGDGLQAGIQLIAGTVEVDGGSNIIINYDGRNWIPDPHAKIEVGVDIKPGSCPNPLNVRSKGVLPVAILGAKDLDVNTIDIASIRLEEVAPIRSSVKDVAAPVTNGNECECTEDGPDGYPDLALKFETEEIVNAIGEVNHGDIVELNLVGALFEEFCGEAIEGADCVLIRGKFKQPNKADINGDGVVDFCDFNILSEQWLKSNKDK